MANLFDQANERKKWDATIAQVGQMGYPQNPAQPPAFTSPQQLADGGMVARMKSASTTQPQRLADGGFVSAAKRMMGLTPEDPARAARLAEYKANAEREKAAAKAASAQATAPAPQAAISQYSGMSAMQRREKELGLADGGRVRPRGFVAGSGTGTSDSIPARLSNGEYVLPADTVKAVGVEALDALRAATHTPVKHEQAKAAHGFFAGGTPGGLDEEKLKNSFGDAAAVARDSSVAQVGGLANNGGADASRFATVPAPIGTQPGRTPEPAAQPAAPVPTAASTQSARQPLDAQAASDRAKLGAAWDTVKDVNDSAGRAIADVAMLAPRAVAGAYDSAVVRPMRAAGFNAGYLSPILVPNGVDPSSMTPYADQKRMQEQAGAVAPSAPAATSSVAATASTAGAGRGVVNPPLAKPSAPAPSAPQPEAKTGNEIMPGVFKHGRGQYSDQSTGMGMPAGFTGRPNQQNMAAAANLAASQQAPAARSLAEAALSQPSGVQAPTVRNSTNDWAARNNLRNMQVSASSITNTPEWSRGATTNWRGQQVRGQADQDGNVAAYQAALKSDLALQQAQPGMDQAAMRENAGIQREGMQQDGATTRTGMQERGSMGRTMAQAALEQQKINQAGESQGFANRAAGRLEALQTAYQTAKTPEERSTLAQQIRGIQGRNDPAEWGVQVTPTTKNIDGSTSMGSIVRYNKATGQTEVVQQPGQGGGAQPSANHLAALKANPKQAAQFDEVYGPGAAARALKGG